jgi:glycosyl transferase family 25
MISLAPRCAEHRSQLRPQTHAYFFNYDCNFISNFHDRQAEVAGWLESTPWDIAYLAHAESISGPPRLIPWGTDSPIMLTHCYAVTGHALSRLPGYLEAITLRPPGSPEGGPMSVDGGLSWFRRQNPQVQTVLAAPSLAYQRSSRSDLSPRWFNRVPVFRDTAENLQAWCHRRRIEA